MKEGLPIEGLRDRPQSLGDGVDPMARRSMRLLASRLSDVVVGSIPRITVT